MFCHFRTLCMKGLNINYLEWMICDIKQKGMEYLHIIKLQPILGVRKNAPWEKGPPGKKSPEN